MIAEAGVVMMDVVDTVIVSRAGTLAMSALALGTIIFFATVHFAFTAALGAEPLISQAHGRKNAARAWGWGCQAFYLGILLSLPLMAVALLIVFGLEAAGVPSEIADETRSFLFARLPAYPAIASAVVFRFYLSATQRSNSILKAVLVANALNAFLDIGLVFGHFGFPRLGVVGSGWATTSCNYLLLGMWSFSAWRRTRLEHGTSDAMVIPRPSFERMRRIFHLGWPAGTSLTLDTAVLMIISTLIGSFGAIQLAAHQIANAVSSLNWMCTNGLANATAARVGHHIGQEEPLLARRSGQIAIATSAVVMMTLGAICVVFASGLSSLFSSDPPVHDVSTTLVRIVGLVAVFDGIQLVAAGALRGTGDTRSNLYAGLVAYWVIGLPLGYLLGSVFGWGAAGYWTGHTTALVCLAVFLVVRFWNTSASLERLEKTHHSVIPGV